MVDIINPITNFRFHRLCNPLSMITYSRVVLTRKNPEKSLVLGISISISLPVPDITSPYGNQGFIGILGEVSIWYF